MEDLLLKIRNCSERWFGGKHSGVDGSRFGKSDVIRREIGVVVETHVITRRTYRAARRRV